VVFRCEFATAEYSLPNRSVYVDMQYSTLLQFYDLSVLNVLPVYTWNNLVQARLYAISC
jgi:hypothetical protein